MPISSQYEAEKSALNLEFAKSAITVTFDKNDAGLKGLYENYRSTLDDEARRILGIEVEETGTNNASENKVDAVLSSNGDQNNGDFLTIAKNLCGLSSMNYFEDGKEQLLKMVCIQMKST